MQTEVSDRPTSMSTEQPPVDIRRQVAMHCAAQVLADADHCRDGLSPVPLSRLKPADREWYRQAARNVIEIFEQLTINREPDAVAAQRSRAEVQTAQATDSRLQIERSRAAVAAADRGHELSAWQPGPLPGIEAARCFRCNRAVVISLQEDPVLSGSALTEGCLTSIEGGL